MKTTSAFVIAVFFLFVFTAIGEAGVSSKVEKTGFFSANESTSGELVANDMPIDEDNNANTTTIEVLPENPLPDLVVIDLEVSPNPMYEDDRYSLSYTVKNVGFATAARAFRVEIYFDGELFFEQGLPGLGPGGEITTHFDGLMALPAGPHQFEVEVDANNDILELDETNNITRGTFWVLSVSDEEFEMAEVGKVMDLTHLPQTVTLNHTFVNPVVFAQPLSQNGADTAVVRITEVMPDRFTLYVHEAPNKDGAHAPETVSFLVIEAGRWELADGTRLEVGSVRTAVTAGRHRRSRWAKVRFGEPFLASPVVLSQVQTNNDPLWVKTRQKRVSEEYVHIAMEEEEGRKARRQMRGEEQVGWLAMEVGAGEWSGHWYEVGRTGSEVTQAWHPLTFGQIFDEAPRFLAALGSYNGYDSAHLRYDMASLNENGVRVRVEEDTVLDPETGHVGEVVNYLLVEGDGLLRAKYRPAAGSFVVVEETVED
jgi:hypothetical protein